MLSGFFGLIIIISCIVLTVVIILMPFYVLQIRNYTLEQLKLTRETNSLLRAIADDKKSPVAVNLLTPK